MPYKTEPVRMARLINNDQIVTICVHNYSTQMLLNGYTQLYSILEFILLSLLFLLKS